MAIPITAIPTTTKAEKPPARTATCMIYLHLVFKSASIMKSTNLRGYITCNASLADRLAALETRTFARTDTHIPTYPATPEHRAPRRNAATVMYADVALQQHVQE